MKKLFGKLGLVVRIVSRVPFTVVKLKPYLMADIPYQLKIKMVFYGCSVPEVLGKKFLDIQKVITDDKLLVLGAAIIPVIDYLNDHMGYTHDYLVKIYDIENLPKPKNGVEAVFVNLIEDILRLTDKNKNAMLAIRENLRAQVESLSQYQVTDVKKLKTLLANKGGLGIIQYCTILDPSISNKTRETLYQMGY